MKSNVPRATSDSGSSQAMPSSSMRNSEKIPNWYSAAMAAQSHELRLSSGNSPSPNAWMTSFDAGRNSSWKSSRTKNAGSMAASRRAIAATSSAAAMARRRSEEHTSELQSQSNLVCRLLLEKKKKQKTT